MTQRKRTSAASQKLAATNVRNFRTFLLVEQFAAKEIGARIAHARDLRGLTQPELAAMASFSVRSLQDYEAGVTIPYKHMRELSRLLKKPHHWFLYGDEEDEEEATQRLIRLEAQLANVESVVQTVLQEVRRLHDDPPDEAPGSRTEDSRLGAGSS